MTIKEKIIKMWNDGEFEKSALSQELIEFIKKSGGIQNIPLHTLYTLIKKDQKLYEKLNDISKGE